MKHKVRERELDYYARVDRMGRTEIGPVIYRHLDTQNDKSAAILTYLSLMSAVSAALVAILAQQQSARLFVEILFGVLIIFVGLATLSLRTILVTSPTGIKIDAEEHLKRLMTVARQRRRAHNFVVRASMVASMGLIFTLIAFAVSTALGIPGDA